MAAPPGIAVPRPPLLHRISMRWWVAIDVGLSTLLLFGGLTSLFLGHHHHRNPAEIALLLVALGLATFALPFRRTYPVLVLALITVPVVVGTLLGEGFAGTPVIAAPVYMVATQCERKESLWLTGAAGVVFLGALGLAHLVRSAGGSLDSIDTVDNLIAAGVAWFLGDSVRSRRAYVAGSVLQAEQRQRLEVERAQKALVEERLHIARELHDIVAHSLSVIAVQSGVGRHVLDAQPEEARQALAAIETTSRSALEDLRRVLGVLRSHEPEGEGPSLAPVPGLAELGGLLDQCREAGLTVTFHQHGRVVPVSPSLDLSLYRIVQEALTNVTKHAGTAQASVDITFEPGAVVISVVDEGALHRNGAVLPNVTAGAHHGIVGMRERTAMFGGTLIAAPRPAGGFEVRARLPIAAATS